MALAFAVATVNGRTAVDLTGEVVSPSGDAFPNSTGKDILLVANGDSSPVTITFAIPITVDGQAVVAKTVTVPANKTIAVGPFPPATYNDGAGKVAMTYTGVTGTLRVKLARLG